MTKHRLELKGALIAYGGRLNKVDWGYAERRIRERGGQTSDAISARLTCFVAGTQAQSKITRARARGVPIITEAQLATLLEDGVLEWEEAPAFEATTTFDESVAELRAIFNAAPTSSAWTRCLEIVEGCDPERLEDLITYAQSFITAWDRAEMGKWSPPDKHPLLTNAPKYWASGLPADELRVAPPLWLFDIAQGRAHPKHALARALNLEGVKLNGTLGENVLNNKHLRHLRWLNLGVQNPLPAKFFRAMRTSELMRTVRELWLGGGRDHIYAEWKDPEHTFTSLILVRTYDRWPSGNMRALPCLKGVPVQLVSNADMW